MILPYPQDIQKLKEYPATLSLVALNVLLFVMIFSGAASDFSGSHILDSTGLELTGRLYHQYVQTLPDVEKKRLASWVRDVEPQSEDHLSILGAYALRDSRFVSVAEKMTFQGDVVQIRNWKNNFQAFQKKYESQLLYRFGLSSSANKPLSWVTYQFSHSNWIHLLSNLVFLVVMGMAVESLVGGAGLLVIYLLGGFFGGYGFLLLDPLGTVPMVGASASISALLAFYCLAETKQRVRYVYFISPVAGYYGAIFLPTLLMIPLFLVSDVASLWATPEGMGSGVAYAAHLGGALGGGLLGFSFRGRPLYPRSTSL